MEVTKRFSIRHGMEPEPSAPLFDDAPPRLRYFLVEAFQTYISYHRALGIVGRALCKPKLATTYPGSPIETWLEINGYIHACQSWEIYNLIEEVWRDLVPEKQRQFAKALNEVFGKESIGWTLDHNGNLQRILPAAIQGQVEHVFRELEDPRFAPALVQVRSAHKAYNARPRADLDVCMNIFDALESVAKEVFSLPTATFGDVLKKARGTISPETISTLQKLGGLASSHFRHGRTEPFALKPAETDFVYVTCLAGMMLFVRLDPALT
jgi:AbiJ N-terminal domain 4